MIGQRFGKQVVLREVGNGRVEVKCDCGRIKTTPKQYILSGESRSCGCGRYADRSEPVLVGQQFFELTVVQKIGTNGHKREVLCQCSCGAHKVIFECDLRRGDTKSCGCLRRSRAKGLNKRHGESGQRKTALYNTWSCMWERTRNAEKWPSYARQGIKVDPVWKTFEAFRDYVNENLGPRPKGFSLDRIDNEKGYTPGNVRWASAKNQTRNRSSNVFITANGQTHCIAEWAEISNLTALVICARRRNGWSDEDAVLTPIQKYVRKE